MGTPQTAEPDTEHVHDVATAFGEALLAGDAARAEDLALDLLRDHPDLGLLYDEVIAQGLRLVGERWADGRLTIAEEHHASSIAQQTMQLARAATFGRPARDRERVLVTAVGGELHDIGLRMVADLAEAAGFDVVFLGAALPTFELHAAVARHEPLVLALGATIPATLEEVDGVVRGALRAAPGLQIVLGGRAAGAATTGDPRVFRAASAREALATIERLSRRRSRLSA